MLDSFQINSILMKNKRQILLFFLLVSSIFTCAQSEQTAQEKKEKVIQLKPHKYGGWYCPDNLTGFPAVDFNKWNKVPVIANRLPTKKEVETEASLIYIDAKEYPTAQAIEIKLPQLATFYNINTRRNELVIVIQAISIGNDSIVGFRYLNGGNGSARIEEVKFLENVQTSGLVNSKFVSLDMTIRASEDKIWKVLTDTSYIQILSPIFDKNKTLKKKWRSQTNMNYAYSYSGIKKAQFGGKHFGSFYIQNDYETLNYSEKIFISQNNLAEFSKVQLVFGPFLKDFDKQEIMLTQWLARVKLLSEVQTD